MSPSSEKSAYALLRILGNELPPRDVPGARVRTLRFILENEPRRPECRRFWILNHIADAAHAGEVKALLTGHGEEYAEIPFDLRRYLRIGDPLRRLNYAINVNAARNHALRLGQAMARFTFLLDGDCMILPQDWPRIRAELEADQRTSPQRRYYSLPTVRASFDQIRRASLDEESLEEPMLAFRDDATLAFNEDLAFGSADKVELLERLGHSSGMGRLHVLAHEELCKSLVKVVHCDGELDLAAESASVRWRLRALSLRAFVARLDKEADTLPGPVPALWRWIRDAAHGAALREFFAEHYRFSGRPVPAPEDGRLGFIAEDGQTLWLSPRLGRFVSRCATLHPVSRHIRDQWERLSWPERAALMAETALRGPEGIGPARLERIFEELIRRKLFASAREILALYGYQDPGPAERVHAAPAAAAQPLDFVAIVPPSSLDEALLRALEAQLASLAEQWKNCELVLLRDREGTLGDPALAEAAIRLGARTKMRVSCLDSAWTQGMIDRLVAGGIARSTAEFALLGTPGVPSNVGTRYNALLLHGAGKKGFCFRVCDEARAQDLKSLATLHARHLGRSFADCAPLIGNLGAHGLERLRARATVSLTFAPHRPGKPAGAFHHKGIERERTFANIEKKSWDNALSGGGAVTDPRYACGCCLGVDARELLPPFMPAGRYSEGVFGQVHAACAPERLALQLPKKIPADCDRAFESDLLSRTGVCSYDVLAACVEAAARGVSGDSPAQRLAALGQNLAEAGRKPSLEFESDARQMLSSKLSRYSGLYKANAKRKKKWPALLDTEEAFHLVAAARKQAAREDYIVPWDLTEAAPAPRARALSQSLVASYGELLESWPRMLSLAQGLPAGPAPAPPAHSAAKVGVCVSTYLRPESLERLLDGLREQTFALVAAPEIRVIVVDNDPSASARGVCEKADSYPWGLHYFVEEQRGIPQSRNRAVREARALGCAAFAFIDDDEVPSRRWLDHLLGASARYRAELVQGPVEYVGEDADGEATRRYYRNTGDRLYWAATNNLLVHKAVFERVGGFEESWALVGGTDMLLTWRASRAGFTIVWCEEALTSERVDSSRSGSFWILQRNFRLGCDRARMRMALEPGWRSRGAAIRSGARLALGGLKRLLLRDARSGKSRLRVIVHGLGRVYTGLGLGYEEYRWMNWLAQRSKRP
ncbi:MAG: glycosyltransferase family 2 protein [Elusimicrobia bacterium]|nr:glycosyltransferase family 2 protein [Elusimicrobiota bacterium]